MKLNFYFQLAKKIFRREQNLYSIHFCLLTFDNDVLNYVYAFKRSLYSNSAGLITLMNFGVIIVGFFQ